MIYVVSGYMRSGTSMMMQALEAGGMPVLRSERRDRLNESHADEQYRPNPISLYEPDPREMTLGWPRQHDGLAIKVVVPFLPRLSVHEYKVCFMRRDPEEIRQSYEGAFGQRLDLERIERATSEALLTLRNRRDVELTELWYPDVIEHGLDLDWPCDMEKANAVINPDLYRFRRERLTVGI